MREIPYRFSVPPEPCCFNPWRRIWAPSALGVLLTGMGDDGASGLLDIRRSGGYTIAEDESTAVVYGMPAAAVRMGAVCESLPLPAIAPRVLELVSCQTEASAGDERLAMKRAFRIVVVEDSETQAFKLRLLLEEQGWQVSVAGAAEAALAALGDPLPDLILVRLQSARNARRRILPAHSNEPEHARHTDSDDDRLGSGYGRDTKPGKRRGRLRFQVREHRNPAAAHPRAVAQSAGASRHSESRRIPPSAAPAS